MYFATPIAVLGAVTVAGLIAAYLYRAHFRRREVSSLMLWRFAAHSGGGGRKRDRLRTPPLFYLELLALSVLVFASLSPHVRRTAVPPLTVVLDMSASMSAVGADGQTPASRAAKFLAAEIEKNGYPQIKVIAAPAEGPRVFGLERPDAVGLTSGKYGAYTSAGDSISESVARAKSLAPKGGEIAVVTDKAPPEGFDGSGGVSWFAFGEPVGNAAVLFASRTSGDSGADAVYAEFRRFPAGNTAPLAVAIADVSSKDREPLRYSARPDAVTGKARFSAVLPEGFGDAVLTLIEKDAVECDNTVRLAHFERPSFEILAAISDDGLANTVRRAVSAGAIRADGASGNIVEFTDNPAWRRESGGRKALLRVVFYRQENPVLSQGPYLPDSASPLLEGVDFSALSWPVGAAVPPGKAVLFAGDVPVIAYQRTVYGPEIGVMVAGANDAFFRSTAWPAFIWNVFDFAAKFLPDADERARAATPCRFPSDEADCTNAAHTIRRSRAPHDFSSSDFRPLAVWCGLGSLLLVVAHQFLSAGRRRREEGGLQ